MVKKLLFKLGLNRKRPLPAFPLAFQAGALALTVGLALSGRPWVAGSALGPVLPSQQISVWGFLTMFTAATVLMVIMLRWRHGSRIFGAFFMLAVFMGSAGLGLALFGEAGAVIFFSLSVFLNYAISRVWSFDLILIVGLAGVSLSLGSGMNPTGIAIILALLSVYDIWAVYGSKHMVSMAKRLVKGNAPFALIVPIKPNRLRVSLKRAGPDSGILQLGTGDLVLPSIMAVSAARGGPFFGIFVLIGAIIGLTFNLVVFFKQDRPRPIPALPAPAASAVLGYLVASFLL